MTSLHKTSLHTEHHVLIVILVFKCNECCDIEFTIMTILQELYSKLVK